MPLLDESRVVSPTAGSALFHAVLMLLMVAAGAGFAGCAARGIASPEIIDGVEFVYQVPHRLRDRQKRDLLWLASSQGMTNLDRVMVTHALPLTLLMASTSEKPVFSDRDERVRTLIFHFNWGREAMAPPTNAPQRGTVWLASDFTRHYKLLKVADKTYRVTVDESIPIAVAEDILRRFLTGNLEPIKSVKWYSRWIENSEPTAIRRREDGRYRIEFWSESRGAGNTFSFTRQPETGAIEVTGTGSINI